MNSNAQSIAAVALVSVATALFSVYGLRPGRATSDFYVASRAVSPFRNASAIGGEYLSAASFLGIAGLVLAYGAEMLWFGVGYTAGYLVLLAFVAAPLRRSGAYTLPDFAEARLESLRVRRLTALLVVFTGWLYLLPQLQGAGLTLRTVTDAPLWVGPVIVTTVVMITVASGGMRSVTFVQAFQYWLKLTALAIPVIFLLLAWRADGAPWPSADAPPRFREATTVSVQQAVRVHVEEPVTVTVRGSADGHQLEDAPVRLTVGAHQFGEGTRVRFPAGADVPHPAGQEPLPGKDWSRPLSGTPYPVYGTYSLLLATLLGTMGLPHVIVRFYTNPDGAAARRTTWAVLWLLAAFYVLPPVYGALGRLYTPELLMTGRTDAAVLLLPTRLVDGAAGVLLGTLVTAGAFAAFLSTACGLTVSVAGVLGQELGHIRAGLRARLTRHRMPVGRPRRGKMWRVPRLEGRADVLRLRFAGVAAACVPCVLSLALVHRPAADVVGLAFAVAASSFSPLLLLGIWWRGLTPQGAVAGLLVGGGATFGAVAFTMVGRPFGGWMGAVLSRPAAWSVPLAFVVMMGTSWLTRSSIPPTTARTLVRLHAPESLVLPRRGSAAMTADDSRRIE
ncbi:cation acetate symporter [Streptomyces sp. HUCO-GS316]|uniref:sodium/solute symporter n=1 Tax=Streptomyces sp. HUCO-GS316 TaxID=2692198 RepID=UPI00136CE911|nr:cation acetate symporter [Streptomyces sp. HUCO-GS316]MXM64631.1 cation acetate symporter [Streptomyces sp. HUCO-GS316]